MINSSELYEQYKKTMQRIADIKYSSAVLQWDQETYLPPKSSYFRNRQITTLNELAHDAFINKSTGDLLIELSKREDLTDRHKRNVELTLVDYNRAIKLSTEFVGKLSNAISRAYHSWMDARKANSFTLFQSALSELVELKKQEAEMLGYSDHPYNALLNDYDKGLTVKTVDNLFNALQPRLISILRKIQSLSKVDDSFLKQHFPKDIQWLFGMDILKDLKFDFTHGRQDLSEHPFTTNFSSKDVRITTRIDENDFQNMTWSCIHEAGHALYEQGLPEEEYGLPLGEYCSLSIHESQSRLWENCIGRGRPFWKNKFDKVKEFFPAQFNNVETESFYKAINKIEPSPVRTEADEITYHFHIMIRYELEKKLIDGSLNAKDIPAYWNEQYKNYLGIEILDDKTGCLQDVHWCHGSFGYFPTYSIGSLYAAQFYNTIKSLNPDLENKIEVGNYDIIHTWLNEEIYPFGRYYNSEELCLKATGEKLNPDYFIDYISKKFNL